jgi:hypothetical protein
MSNAPTYFLASPASYETFTPCHVSVDRVGVKPVSCPILNDGTITLPGVEDLTSALPAVYDERLLIIVITGTAVLIICIGVMATFDRSGRPRSWLRRWLRRILIRKADHRPSQWLRERMWRWIHNK